MGDEHARYNLDGMVQRVGSKKRVCTRKDKDRETIQKASRDRAEDQDDIREQGKVSAIGTAATGRRCRGIHQDKGIHSLGKLGESMGTTVCKECGRMPSLSSLGSPPHSNIFQACRPSRVPGVGVG